MYTGTVLVLYLLSGSVLSFGFHSLRGATLRPVPPLKVSFWLSKDENFERVLQITEMTTSAVVTHRTRLDCPSSINHFPCFGLHEMTKDSQHVNILERIGLSTGGCSGKSAGLTGTPTSRKPDWLTEQSQH